MQNEPTTHAREHPHDGRPQLGSYDAYKKDPLALAGPVLSELVHALAHVHR